jgi:integrase
MPRRKRADRDGIYQRRDRPGQFWGSWVAANGQRRQRRLRGVHTLTAAKELLSAQQLKVEQTRLFGFAPPTKQRFKEIEARYLLHQKARLSPAGYERERHVVEKHLDAFFGEMKLGAIRRGDIAAYVTKRSTEVAPATILKEANTVKHLFKMLVEWELLPVSPAQQIKTPKVPEGRARWLRPEELRGVLEAAPEWLRPVIGLACATGMRRGELLNVRWFDVDTANGSILLRKTKNGKPRTVFLNESAQLVLASLPKGKVTDRLFPKVTPAQVSMAFIRTVRELGIEDVRWHDLRHTFASLLRQSGAPLEDISELLGHSDLRMTRRYSHVGPDHLATAARRFDQALGSPLILPPASNQTAQS